MTFKIEKIISPNGAATFRAYRWTPSDKWFCRGHWTAITGDFSTKNDAEDAMRKQITHAYVSNAYFYDGNGVEDMMW